jgi:DNA-binding response OmpR family regulator
LAMFIQTTEFPGQLPHTLHFHDALPETQIQKDRRQSVTNCAVNGTSRTLEILLVESDPDAAKLIGEAVDNTGLDQYLTIAGDADEGMSYLYQEEPFEHARLPDIVLLKLRLPRTDGLAVLGAVKRIRASARRLVAIVVLAAFDDERTKRAALALGADACFVEPKGAEDSATLSKKIRDLWECLASSAHPVLEPFRA